LLERIREEKKRLVKEKKIILSKPEKACKIKDDGEFELPPNWKWAMVNDICRVYGRIGFRGYTKEDLRNSRENAAISISPSNMVDGSLVLDSCTYISEEKYEESPEIKINEGDILIVKTGSSYGKTSLVRHLPWKSTINPQIAAIKNVAIDKQFLLYFFQSPYAQSKFNDFVLGTSIPTFSQLNLISMQIPLPPLAEQKRIVAKIEEVFKEIDKLKK
jgi:type I restriction enzyme S subunit